MRIRCLQNGRKGIDLPRRCFEAIVLLIWSGQRAAGIPINSRATNLVFRLEREKTRDLPVERRAYFFNQSVRYGFLQLRILLLEN